MKRFILVFMVFCLVSPAFAGDDMAARLNAVLLKGPQEGNWQVKAADVAQWIKQGKKDFLVVDVRMNPQEYKSGHIPGAIFIPYNAILKPENLKKLPKDKMIVLACVTGQTQNLPVLALRALGYDARTISFGHTAWIKGYYGGKIMQGAIAGAASGNYPLAR
jgi:rhodanese-related sulfurtransferase